MLRLLRRDFLHRVEFPDVLRIRGELDGNRLQTPAAGHDELRGVSGFVLLEPRVETVRGNAIAIQRDDLVVDIDTRVVRRRSALHFADDETPSVVPGLEAEV